MAEKTNLSKGSLAVGDNRRQFENTSSSRAFTQHTFQKKRAEQTDRTNLFKQALGLAQQAVGFTAETQEQAEARRKDEAGIVAQNTYIAQKMLQEKLQVYQGQQANLSKYGSGTEVREFNQTLADNWHKDVEAVNKQAFNGSPAGYSSILKLSGIHTQFNSLLTGSNALQTKKEQDSRTRVLNGNFSTEVSTLLNEDPINGSTHDAEVRKESALYDLFLKINPYAEPLGKDQEEFLAFQQEQVAGGFSMTPQSQTERLQGILSTYYTSGEQEGVPHSETTRKIITQLKAKYAQTADIKYLDMMKELKTPDNHSIEMIADSAKGQEQQIGNLRSRHDNYTRQFEAMEDKNNTAKYATFQKERVDIVQSSFEDALGDIFTKANQGIDLTPDERGRVDAWSKQAMTTVDPTEVPMYGGADGMPVARNVAKYIKSLSKGLLDGSPDDEASKQFIIDLGAGKSHTNEEIVEQLGTLNPEARSFAVAEMKDNVAKAKGNSGKLNALARSEYQSKLASAGATVDTAGINQGYLASLPAFKQKSAKATADLKALNNITDIKAIQISKQFLKGELDAEGRDLAINELYRDQGEQAEAITEPMRADMEKVRESSAFQTGVKEIVTNTADSPSESFDKLQDFTSDIPVEELDAELTEAIPDPKKRKQTVDLLTKGRSLKGESSEEVIGNAWDFMKGTDPAMKEVNELLEGSDFGSQALDFVKNEALNVVHPLRIRRDKQRDTDLTTKVTQSLNDTYMKSNQDQLRILSSQNGDILDELERLQLTDPEAFEDKYGSSFWNTGEMDVLEVLKLRKKILNDVLIKKMKDVKLKGSK